MAPVTFIVTLILSVGIFYVPRSKVVPIFVVGMCFVPASQALVLVGLDFKVLRILAILATIRIVINNEHARLKVNKMDKLFILWGGVSFITYNILWLSFGALIFQFGRILDTFLVYFVFRACLRSVEDIRLVMLTLVGSMIVLTPLVLYELLVGRNAFSIMGHGLILIRDGRIRCMASFSHPILLGSFAASVVPLAIALLKENKVKKYRKYYILGVLCSLWVTAATVSSGPLIGLGAGLAAILAFKFRKYTGKMTLAVIALVVIIHFSMKAPVWHLVSRINLTGSSTGYHRFTLIDQTIKNFNEWALFGVKGVSHWGVWAGDVTSMFVEQAVTGGFPTFFFFCWALFFAMKVAWKLSMYNKHQWLVWGFFCTLFSHSISFISVAYFGQALMLLILSFSITAVFIDNARSIISVQKKTTN